MKIKYIFSIGIAFMLCSSILLPSKSLASWAYSFVVWDGYVYVVTDETVKDVDKEIGHVTKHSDKEGTYSGNFSNVYPKGTKYYSIIDVNVDQSIAIQNDTGTYIKANRDGEYAGNKYGLLNISSLATLVFGLLAILGIYFIKKSRRLFDK